MFVHPLRRRAHRHMATGPVRGRPPASSASESANSPHNRLSRSFYSRYWLTCLPTARMIIVDLFVNVSTCTIRGTNALGQAAKLHLLHLVYRDLQHRSVQARKGTQRRIERPSMPELTAACMLRAKRQMMEFGERPRPPRPRTSRRRAP